MVEGGFGDERREDHGYAAVGAANGKDALDKLVARALEPALIVLDLMMPVMDGRTFRDEQLRDPDLARIPVIVVSAFREAPAVVADMGGSLEAAGADARDDSSPDTGSVLCAGLLCEDFEKGQIDPSIWDVKTGGGGTLSVQQQTVAHGKFAMQVHALAGPTQDFAFIVTKSAPAALQGTSVYGRAYFLITPDPLTSTHTEMIFAGTNGTGPNNGAAPFPKLRYMEVANLYGAWQLGLDLMDQSPPVEIVAYPNKNVPTMTWTCMEWHFEDQPDRITLWTNGNLIGTFDDQHIGFTAKPVPLPLPGEPIYQGTSSGIVGGFDQFGFGFHDFGPKKPFDLYYDDVVLGTKRVGCLP